MMVTIGSARADENGTINGGMKGDQNGLEVSTQPWYLHSKGWYILRPTSSVDAKRISKCMSNACKNENIGYSQKQNNLYEVAKTKGFDTSKIDIPVDGDCSTLVRVCLAYAGIFVEWFSTANEVDVIMRTGKFALISQKSITNTDKELKVGDILVTRTKGHTVVVTEVLKEPEPQIIEQPFVSYPKEYHFWGIIHSSEKIDVFIAPRTSERLRDYPKLSNGNGVTVVGQDCKGVYAYVLIDGKYYGYVKMKYVYADNGKKNPYPQSIYPPEVNVTPWVAKVKGLEPGDTLSVRVRCGSQFVKLKMHPELGEGNKVDVIGTNKNGSWAFVNIVGLKGWVMKSYLVRA